MYENITTENVMMFAIKHYDNPQCEGEKEFHDDMKRFKYIKRLLRKHKESGILKERLLLNHIIILNNLFGPEACVTLILFKIQREYWETLKSFLLYLNIVRDDELSEIIANQEVLEVLRKL
jgi:small nuclear ribonucleoprotein (snRNP)-like protein